MSSHRRKRRQRRTRRLVGFLFLFLVSYLLITTFLLEVVRVSDNSMAPTMEAGDVLLASPLLHRIDRLRRIERGDLVLLENPALPPSGAGGRVARRFVHFFTLGRVQGRAAAGAPLLLRRVVGLPGDRILLDEYRFYLRESDGRWIDEMTLSGERYDLLLPEGEGSQTPWPAVNTPGAPDSGAHTIPPESFYFGADNRGGPLDSRIWGSQGLERLRGPVFLRLLPLERFGTLDEQR